MSTTGQWPVTARRAGLPGLNVAPLFPSPEG